MDDLRTRISFQRDIRDCKILYLTETWLTPTVPDTAVTPSDNFSVLRMDRTAEAGKTKGGGVCFMINKKWCDPRNISILSFTRSLLHSTQKCLQSPLTAGFWEIGPCRHFPHTGIQTKARSGTPGGEGSDSLVHPL